MAKRVGSSGQALWQWQVQRTPAVHIAEWLNGEAVAVLKRFQRLQSIVIEGAVGAGRADRIAIVDQGGLHFCHEVAGVAGAQGKARHFRNLHVSGNDAGRSVVQLTGEYKRRRRNSSEFPLCPLSGNAGGLLTS